jgi:glycosyltransferase involved in cell wall biosynthesis
VLIAGRKDGLMRVVYSIPQPLGSTGIGMTAWHHVDALARAGAEVTVVCTRLNQPFDDELKVRVTQTLGPIRPRLIGMANAHRLHDLRAAHIVERLHPTVVHTWPRAVRYTAIAAGNCSVLCIREAPSPYTRAAVLQAKRAWAELGLDVPARHFHRISESELQLEDEEFRAAHAVTVGSQQAAESFALAPFPVRVEVNPYGYDSQLFPQPADEPQWPPVAAFVGRCEPAKGIHTLLRAWRSARLPAGSRLLLCGALPDMVRRALGDLLDFQGVEPLGHVRDVPAVLRSSDLLVLPSFSEGSALVGYEALGAGAVPLVSTASGCPVIHDVSGLIHATGDEEGLAAHLEQAMGNPAELGRLRAGAISARGEWTWEVAGKRLLSLYRRLTDECQPPSAAARQDR